VPEVAYEIFRIIQLVEDGHDCQLPTNEFVGLR